jgi:hypothetical protein
MGKNDTSCLRPYVHQQENPANGNQHHMLSQAGREPLEPASGPFNQYNEKSAACGSESLPLNAKVIRRSNDTFYLDPQGAGYSTTSVSENTNSDSWANYIDPDEWNLPASQSSK